MIVYDHRGVGASTPLDRRASRSAQMAEDAAGLLAALELDSADVLGISMGGMIAQELALTHPERVRTLTLGCTYCGGEGSSLAGPEVAQKLGRSDDVRRPRARPARRLGGQRLSRPTPPTRRLERVPRDRPAARRRGSGDHGPDAGLHGPRHARPARRRSRRPTLVIHGTDGSDDPRRQRAADRRADSRRRSSRSSTASATCSSGSGPSRLAELIARRTPPSRPRPGAEPPRSRWTPPSWRSTPAGTAALGAGERRGPPGRAAARADGDPALRGDGLADARALRPPRDRLRRPRSRPLRAGGRRALRLRAPGRGPAGRARRGRGSSGPRWRAPRWAPTRAVGFALEHPERVAGARADHARLRPRARRATPPSSTAGTPGARAARRAAWRASSTAYDLDGCPSAVRPTVETVLRQRLVGARAPGRRRRRPRSRAALAPLRARCPSSAAIAVPTLVVASRDEPDPGHPLAVGEAWAAAIPGARAARRAAHGPPRLADRLAGRTALAG